MEALGSGANSAKAAADLRIDPRFRGLLTGKLPKPPEWAKSLGSKEGLSIVKHEVESRPDGNKIDVIFVRPEGQASLPCVMYLHGGGMAFASSQDPPWSKLGRILAHQGLCVAMVDFRNSVAPSKPGKEVGKYPKGLNDCMSALEWINDNKASLGVGERIIVSGESGGGNLSLALTMKCKRDGKLGLLHGCYALCPYIAGKWPQRAGKPGEILGESHLDAVNNGLLLSLGADDTHAKMYGSSAFEAGDPLAWPGFAKEEDVKGLPPCVISVDECDPLRDEGVNFYRLLLRAGVPARCVMVGGGTHGSHLLGVFAAPDITLAVVRSIMDFAVGRGVDPVAVSKL